MDPLASTSIASLSAPYRDEHGNTVMIGDDIFGQTASGTFVAADRAVFLQGAPFTAAAAGAGASDLSSMSHIFDSSRVAGGGAWGALEDGDDGLLLPMIPPVAPDPLSSDASRAHPATQPGTATSPPVTATAQAPHSTGNLYVAGLPATVDDEALRSCFEPFGHVVSAKVMLSVETSKSRGFGFVLFERPESTEAARAALHGKTVPGHGGRMQISLSKHRGENLAVESRVAYLRNVPAAVSLETLSNYCFAFGQRHPRITTRNARGSDLAQSGQALKSYVVEFHDVDAAKQCVTATHGKMPFQECVVPVLAKLEEPQALRDKRLQGTKGYPTTAASTSPGSSDRASPGGPLGHSIEAELGMSGSDLAPHRIQHSHLGLTPTPVVVVGARRGPAVGTAAPAITPSSNSAAATAMYGTPPTAGPPYPTLAAPASPFVPSMTTTPNMMVTVGHFPRDSSNTMLTLQPLHPSGGGVGGQPQAAFMGRPHESPSTAMAFAGPHGLVSVSGLPTPYPANPMMAHHHQHALPMTLPLQATQQSPFGGEAGRLPPHMAPPSTAQQFAFQPHMAQPYPTVASTQFFQGGATYPTPQYVFPQFAAQPMMYSSHQQPGGTPITTTPHAYSTPQRMEYFAATTGAAGAPSAAMPTWATTPPSAASFAASAYLGGSGHGF